MHRFQNLSFQWMLDLEFLCCKLSNIFYFFLGMSSTSGSLSSAGGTSGSSKRIVYGCTTLHNSNQMMQQLSKLGHEMWWSIISFIWRCPRCIFYFISLVYIEYKIYEIFRTICLFLFQAVVFILNLVSSLVDKM